MIVVIGDDCGEFGDDCDELEMIDCGEYGER